MWDTVEKCSLYLGNFAVKSLREEAKLTPKPALVDLFNSGAHKDLNIEIMIKSAESLRDCFMDIAKVSYQNKPSKALQKSISEIGLKGEEKMFHETNGVNTHKGAIFSLGLLVSSAAINKPGTSSDKIVATASILAKYFPDRNPNDITNGYRVMENFGVLGARGEAEAGFPHVINYGLSTLEKARKNYIPEIFARIDALLVIMSNLEDTCLLHRGGMEALLLAQRGAKEIISLGGISTQNGRIAFDKLDLDLIKLNASPGGSADLLAATLFLDKLNSIN